MFERFTERARQVIVLAQEAAREHKHNYIGTEHLLLGLLKEEEGLAARVLGALDLTTEKASKRLTEITGDGEATIDGQLPFTPRTKKVIELSLREALSLGHNYIGTEHVLLGLVRENQGVGARILRESGIDAEKARNEVIRLLSGTGGRRQPVEPSSVVLKLSEGAAQWLAELLGGRPHSEPESAEAYSALIKALAERLRRAA